jgi:phosphotransferase system HPr (HPr) family protein
MSSQKFKGEEVPFLEKKLKVTSKQGLHARPAALFVQLCSQFQSEIILKKGRQKANGKSIMSVLTLAAGPGTQVVIHVRGSDARKALSDIEDLFNGNFGE